MKIDIGESLVNSYLRHVKKCQIVQPAWKPSENWPVGRELYEKAGKEFDRIQRHPAFTEIFKTNFEHTLSQTEVDVLGLAPDNTLYAANVTFHEFGINFGSKTDTRNRVIKNLLRAYLAMICYFPGQKHVLMYCSPRVSDPTEQVINEYFKILRSEFSSNQDEFIYLSNNDFRDQILMGTLDCIQEQFDTSELFLRSFKLLTVYASEPAVKSEPVPEVGTSKPVSGGESSESRNTEKPIDEKGREGAEIEKVLNRIPKWFQHPTQNNSKILIRYMAMLEKSENVTLQQLAAECSDVKNFSGNFAQMNNVAEKNHGKVFCTRDEIVTLWEPVRDFIIREYIEFKKSYYSGEKNSDQA